MVSITRRFTGVDAAAARNAAPAPRRFEPMPRSGGVVEPLPSSWTVFRRRLSRLSVITAALFLVGVVGLSQVLQTTKVAATGYDVQALQQEQSNLNADIRLLEGQIAETSNLEALHAEAVGRLGMVPATRTVSVTVDQPAPAVIPLPRRYVPVVPVQHLPPTTWWERLQAKVPGLH